MNSAQNLSKNLKAIRGSRSQMEFAKEIGITKSTVQALEKGTSVPRLDTLDIICTQLGISIATLLSEDSAVKHVGSLVMLVRHLDCYSRLPGQTQAELRAWLRLTADLMEKIPKPLEGA